MFIELIIGIAGTLLGTVIGAHFSQKNALKLAEIQLRHESHIRNRDYLLQRLMDLRKLYRDIIEIHGTVILDEESLLSDASLKKILGTLGEFESVCMIIGDEHIKDIVRQSRSSMNAYIAQGGGPDIIFENTLQSCAHVIEYISDKLEISEPITSSGVSPLETKSASEKTDAEPSLD